MTAVSFKKHLLPLVVSILVVSALGDFASFGRLCRLATDGLARQADAAKFSTIYDGVFGNSKHNTEDWRVADAFYDLATQFYEYGWGDSFHFGFRHKNEPFTKAITNSQNFLASKLKVTENDRVLDMGCGIGGPLRGVVRATGANITGITINEFQIKRAQEITKTLTPYMQERCHFQKEDYHVIKGLEDNSFDAVFYMETSLHTADRTKTFSEAYRLLKPGGRVVALEYVLLDGWQPDDKQHQELMRLHLVGNGCTVTPTVEEDLQFFRDAGFEIDEHFDYMAKGKEIYGDDEWEWWRDLQEPYSFAKLPAHPGIRQILPPILHFFAWIGLVKEEVPKSATLMNMGGDGLSGLGKVGAMTPEYYIRAVKPLK